LFTGTLEGRIIEILQNARRAGATEVDISNEDGFVTVRDNGQGVDDFARLLDLGGSGWAEDFEASEDPAGVGLFCLAPRDVVIRSNGQIVHISEAGWTGEPVEVVADPEPVQGTILRFPDEEWTLADVEPHAVFTGLQVRVDGQVCSQETFISPKAIQHPELGCRIEIRQTNDLQTWHQSVRRGAAYYDNVLVNFHGQTVSFRFDAVDDRSLHFLVDLTGEPTGIRLMLPARTRLVENETFAELKRALELEAYCYVQRRGHHQLPYKQYLRARELGIELPEATPTFKVGLLSGCDAPEPVEVRMPKDFPLERCHRFDPDSEGAETDETNVHLLAALGEFEEPFVIVDIRKEYDGYSWARLPLIEKVELKVGKMLHSGWLWTGTLTCVESLVITAHASDGRVFSSPVCMAMSPQPPQEAASEPYSGHPLVTPEAQDHLAPSEIWHHFGGWSDEGDTYDTQEAAFEQELDRFWADMVGPDEQLRRDILNTLAGIKPAWHWVQVFDSGKVHIHFQDRTAHTIQPPRARS
jgi:hypothetical protein